MQKSKSIVTKIIRTYALIILIGAFCVVCIDIIGFGLPCLFHLITNLKCPCCGNTTAVMCILALDFKGAFEANMLLPFEINMQGTLYADLQRLFIYLVSRP